MGPLLFVLFINDLSDVVEFSKVNLYADDTAIYLADNDPAVLGSRIEHDLNKVGEWIRENGLKMNASKTQLMVLTRKSKSSIANSVEVCLEGTPLQKRDSVRYLGIEVDIELSWKPHVHNLHHQCMGKLAQIRKSCYHLPCKARKLLYLAFVLPQLDYCSVVWGSCGTVLSNKIERIQNYAMRVILRKPPLTPSEESRKTLRWTTLKTRRHNAVMLQVHRCLHRTGPLYLNSKFVLRSIHENQPKSRGSMRLALHRCPKTNMYRSSFEFQGASLYNHLPDCVKSTTTKNAFLSALKNVVISD